MSDNKKRRPLPSHLKPEKLVEKEVLAMAQDLGFDLSMIDSKAIFSEKKQEYTKNYCVPEGAPDLWGCDSNGVAVYLELKAPGKLKSLSEKQKKFLARKIDYNCFAVAVDSPQLLFDLYSKWKAFVSASDKRDFLLKQISF